MFGYVLPCKMELKMKDYELFRAYYCGLCVAIKKNFGQIPRSVLNYDMTFLAILIDSLNEDGRNVTKDRCMVHPLKKRVKIIDNKALDYAAYCNVILAYFKLLDDKEDEGSLKSVLLSSLFKPYIKKVPSHLNELIEISKENLKSLSSLENSGFSSNIDEISHPFANLTGMIISSYYEKEDFNENLYWLGYNLGRWIYLIDAWDDLKEDMEKGEYNPLNAVFNPSKLSFDQLSKELLPKIEDLLLTCGFNCSENLKRLPLKKNEELLDNILNLGLIEKMDIVIKKE